MQLEAYTFGVITAMRTSVTNASLLRLISSTINFPPERADFDRLRTKPRRRRAGGRRQRQIAVAVRHSTWGDLDLTNAFDGVRFTRYRRPRPPGPNGRSWDNA
ncbi:hypothetical protein EVAR_94108_1 [Eumeta japonica]|uniref:Uncharacterized protein n=1 Tax=Eumeta variegata TaxID=151549 RepID=A0A4C1U733_EUMVA|nr:hypothetical protein EVAR_94108_1 [Eumeta japonica]